MEQLRRPQNLQSLLGGVAVPVEGTDRVLNNLAVLHRRNVSPRGVSLNRVNALLRISAANDDVLRLRGNDLLQRNVLQVLHAVQGVLRTRKLHPLANQRVRAVHLRQVGTARNVQNLRGLGDALQTLLDEVLVLLQVRQVLLGTLNRLIGANNLGSQLNGALQVREVLELNVHRRDTRLSCLRNLLLRGSEQHLRLIGKQLLHVHVGTLHRRVNLLNTGVDLLEPRQRLHVSRGGHQLLSPAEQQNHLVVCVPQVSDALRGGGDGDLLAVNVLNDLGAVTVILHEEAGVLLCGIARS